VRLAVPIEIGIVDWTAGAPTGIGTKLEPDIAASVQHAVARGAASGDSAGMRGAFVFSWRALPDKRILLALSPAERTQLDHSALWTVFALLLLVSTTVAALLAWMLAHEVSRATEALRAEAERMSSGDLRRGEVYESEDELGELSRSFEAMAGALRSTVRRVSQAADRVEATAAEMAGVSEAVSSVTADQVKGIQQTTTSMEAINQQVRGIADSSQTLNVSVEESSSSILELGAAGEELNETASVLSGKVNEVSSSIEQMVRSVKQVLENTEALSEAAVETSASMEEMAMSMREVDLSAEETARLSHQVVASAESGQAKMVQAIEGMEAIREATETAERVIRNLGSRTREIGAIVDVIDDVADETNLLALNAAIIAAQAGEQGKAFSVVADEIKELADRVLASTKEIGGLIRAVQEEGSNAIGAIEKGASSVASGVDLSAEAGESLEEITRASRQSGTRIAGIVSAVRASARRARICRRMMDGTGRRSSARRACISASSSVKLTTQRSAGS
jgi:methyl-accepting chemotaxis protein